MTNLRVLIVDDHPLIRRGLRETLAAEPDLEVCGEAADAGEAIDQARKTKPDLALVDISLPSGSGLELAKRLMTVCEGLRVLFVSMHDDAVFAERALRAGALGYINKSRPGAELLEAVRKVARGQIALSQPIADRLMRLGVGMSGDATGVESLSDRELEVFEMLGRGLSTRDIAEKLCLSPKTIETHREHIKSKLKVENIAELRQQATLWNNMSS